MMKKSPDYKSPQICVEPCCSDDSLCQASPSSFNEPQDLENFSWND
jgi:hypothetical protein